MRPSWPALTPTSSSSVATKIGSSSIPAVRSSPRVHTRGSGPTPAVGGVGDGFGRRRLDGRRTPADADRRKSGRRTGRDERHAPRRRLDGRLAEVTATGRSNPCQHRRSKRTSIPASTLEADIVPGIDARSGHRYQHRRLKRTSIPASTLEADIGTSIDARSETQSPLSTTERPRSRHSTVTGMGTGYRHTAIGHDPLSRLEHAEQVI